MSGVIGYLKESLQTPDITNPKNIENILQLLYCEMMGYKVEFGYLMAISLASCEEISKKRIGYLFSTHFIPTYHELSVMLVGTLQKDLQSSNPIVLDIALRSVCNLVTQASLPAIESQVRRLFHHHKANIRKKALMVMYKLYEIRQNTTDKIDQNRTLNQYNISILSLCQEALSDSNAQVMNSGVIVLHELMGKYNLLNTHRIELCSLVPSLLSILTQISENRLGSSYIYHRIPAPWIQIRILKCLSIIGAGNQKSSQLMYGTLLDIAKRCDNGNQAGYSVLYEVIRCICCIHPNENCLNEAGDYIGSILQSAQEKSGADFSISEHHFSANLKYVGIQLLCDLVKANRTIHNRFQFYIISSLESKDETLLKKTLDLLFSMTNKKNANVIVNKMVSILEKSIDEQLCQELTKKIFNLAISFAKSRVWFLDIINEILKIRNCPIEQEHINYFVSVLKGKAFPIMINKKNDLNEELQYVQSRIVDAYYEKSIVTSEYELSPAYFEVIVRTIGVCASSSQKYSIEEFMLRLCDLAERCPEPSLRRVVVNNLFLVVSSCKDENEYLKLLENPQLKNLLETFRNSHDIQLQQICYEYLNLINKDPQILKELLIFNNNSNNYKLSHLSNFVKERGGSLYDESIRDRVLYETEIFEDQAEPLKIEAIFIDNNISIEDKTEKDKNETNLTDDLVIKPSSNVWGEEIEEIVFITPIKKEINDKEKDIISRNFRIPKVNSNFENLEESKDYKLNQKYNNWNNIFEDQKENLNPNCDLGSKMFEKTKKVQSPWENDFLKLEKSNSDPKIIIRKNNNKIKLHVDTQLDYEGNGSSIQNQSTESEINNMFLIPRQAEYNPNVYTQHIIKMMSQFPPKHQQILACSEDKEISMTYFKVWKPKSFEIIFQLKTNKNPLNHIQLLAQIPENFISKIKGDDQLVKIHESTVNISSLKQSNQEVTIQCTLTLKSNVFDTVFVGKVHYQTTSNPGIFQSVVYEIPIEILDTLRPDTTCTLIAFETDWQELHFERQVKINQCKNPERILSLLEDLQLYNVYSTENEVFASSRLLNLEERCLVKIKIIDNILQWNAKCNTKYVVDAFMLHIERQVRVKL